MIKILLSCVFRVGKTFWNHIYTKWSVKLRSLNTGILVSIKKLQPCEIRICPYSFLSIQNMATTTRPRSHRYDLTCNDSSYNQNIQHSLVPTSTCIVTICIRSTCLVDELLDTTLNVRMCSKKEKWTLIWCFKYDTVRSRDLHKGALGVSNSRSIGRKTFIF